MGFAGNDVLESGAVETFHDHEGMGRRAGRFHGWCKLLGWLRAEAGGGASRRKALRGLVGSLRDIVG